MTAALLALVVVVSPVLAAAEGGSRDALSHKDHGVALYSRGERRQALQEFDRALRLYRDAKETAGWGYADALQWKGRALIESGRREEAVGVLAEQARVTPISPMWAWAVSHEVELLEDLRRGAQASRAAEAGVERCRGSADCSGLVQGILAFAQARQDAELERPDQARDQARPIVSYFLKPAAPPPGGCVDVLALAGVSAGLFERLGDWKDAQAVAQAGQAASSCAPADQHAMEILLRLGEIHAACGRERQAKAAWRQALSGFSAIRDEDGARRAQDLLSNPASWPKAGEACPSEPGSFWRWPWS